MRETKRDRERQRATESDRERKRATERDRDWRKSCQEKDLLERVQYCSVSVLPRNCQVKIIQIQAHSAHLHNFSISPENCARCNLENSSREPLRIMQSLNLVPKSFGCRYFF